MSMGATTRGTMMTMSMMENDDESAETFHGMPGETTSEILFGGTLIKV